MNWIKKKHRIIKKLLSPFFTIPTMLLYHIKIRHLDTGEKNYLILANHQTDADQYIVSAMFKEPVYFVAMEDVLSNGLISRIIQWGAAPIPILKGTTDVVAVKNCIKVAKEGGTICLFPEGNRTYNGKTCYIGPQVAKLVKMLRLPVLILRFEGGYCVKPRWSDFRRKGTMKAEVCRIIEPREYREMDNEELYGEICRDLYVDDVADGTLYPGKRLAEGLERVMYFCPECGIGKYISKGDSITCTSCGRTYRLNPNQTLNCPFEGPQYGTVADIYEAQEKFIRNAEPSVWNNIPAFQDNAKIYEVILYHHKEISQRRVKISIFGNRIEIIEKNGCRVYYYDDIREMTCVAGHKLNMYLKDGLYQIVGDKHFNALKYCNFFYHYKYLTEGHQEGSFQFLGL